MTAGNASSINDAAAAVVLMERELAKKRGLRPLGRLAAYSYAGVDPKYMGIGPVPAVRSLLEKTGLKLEDIDVFEVNEAFAAQALAVARELKLPENRTNPNGSGISLGHPIGATGAILLVKALYELKRSGGKRSLMTMCIGGGQGIAGNRPRDRGGTGPRHGSMLPDVSTAGRREWHPRPAGRQRRAHVDVSIAVDEQTGDCGRRPKLAKVRNAGRDALACSTWRVHRKSPLGKNGAAEREAAAGLSNRRSNRQTMTAALRC